MPRLTIYALLPSAAVILLRENGSLTVTIEHPGKARHAGSHIV
jgi:hypothetical protein